MFRSQRRVLCLPLFVYGSIAALGACVPVARAQQSPPAPAPSASGTQTSPQWRPPLNLKEALPQTHWNNEAHGLLLVLGAEETRPWTPDREPVTEVPRGPLRLLPPPEKGGYPMEEVATYFGRRVVHLSSVSVLAPIQMTVLNSILKNLPDPLAGLRANDKWALFLGTLTPAQWKTLGSVGGLGAGDLNNEQKTLFLSFLANPFRAYKVQQGEDGLEPVGGPQTSLQVAGAERESIRIRINRKAFISIPYDGNSYTYGLSLGNAPSGTFSYLPSLEPEAPNASSFGARLKEELPNALKPGHINWDAPGLNPTVHLAHTQTVAQVLKQVRDATGVEVYADGRVAALSLTALGDDAPARAGDVLKALAWAVTGAYRRVGTAYVLTHDVEGLATIRARMNGWLEQGKSRHEALVVGAYRQIVLKKVAQYITFAADDPYALPPALMARVENDTKKKPSQQAGLVPLSVLPNSMQSTVQTLITRYNQSPLASRQPLGDQARIEVNARMTFLLPNGAQVPSQEFGVTLQGLQSVTSEPVVENKIAHVPATFWKRSALLWAPNEEEWARLPEVADALAKRGVSQWWVRLPLITNRDTNVLQQAVAAGKARQVAVFAVVRALRDAPKTGDADQNRDVNVLGETGGEWAARIAALPEGWPGENADARNDGDWLVPNAPSTKARLTARLRTVAAVAGISGIVLTDTAAPGYSGNEREWNADRWAAEMGYTLPARLTFLRNFGYDPLDMTDGMVRGDTALPFFSTLVPRTIEIAPGRWGADPKVKSPLLEWNRTRQEQTEAALASVYRAFRAGQTNVPLWVRAAVPSDGGWFGTWNVADKLPRARSIPVFSGSGEAPNVAAIALKNAHAISRTAYSTVMFQKAMYGMPAWAGTDANVPGTPQAFYALLQERIAKTQKAGASLAWDGFVLDMTGVPTANLLGFLRDTTYAPESTAK